MAPDNIFNMHTASLLNDVCLVFATKDLYLSREKLKTRTNMFHKMSHQLLKRIWFGGLIRLQLIPLLKVTVKNELIFNPKHIPIGWVI